MNQEKLNRLNELVEELNGGENISFAKYFKLEEGDSESEDAAKIQCLISINYDEKYKTSQMVRRSFYKGEISDNIDEMISFFEEYIPIKDYKQS